MDLATLRTRLLDRAGLPTDDGHLTTAMQTSLINASLATINTDYDWPWLQVEATFSTVAGTQAYYPPQGWTRTLWVADDLGVDLRYVQRRELLRLDSYTGRPSVYAISADRIRLGPTPNAVITMRHAYISSEVQLVADSDTPLCQYPDFIVAGAGVLLSQKLGDSTMHQMFEMERQQWVARVRDQMRRSSSTMTIRTRSDWSL